jgi:hypothetical protein
MRFEDGFSTIITFALDATIEIGERTTDTPGMEGGGPINTTTHRNENVRTQAPKTLYSVSASGATVGYASADISKIKAMLLQNQLITYTYPDGETCQLWGWIEKFDPNGNTEGEYPDANLVVEASNTNESGQEVEPVWSN